MEGHPRNQRYLFWLALGAAAMALAMTVVLVFEIAQKRALERSLGMRTDSITAPAFECEREFLRFRFALESMLYSRRPLDEQAVTLQYELFLSRLTLLRDSPSIFLLAARPEYKTVMPKLEAWVREADPVMGREPLDRRALAVLWEQANALATDVHALSIAANSEVAHLLETQGKNLLQQTQEIVVLTAMQLGMLLVAFCALVLRHRRQVQLQQERQKITEDLRQAHLLAQTAMEKLQRSQEELARSETKAALNTIIASVSHELSTPLGNSLLTASTQTEQGHAFRRLVESQQLKRSELTAFVDTVCAGNDLMQRNLQRAVALLQKFRQVANDQASEQRRTFDLGEVVHEVLYTLAPSLKRYPQRVVEEIPPGIVMDSMPGPLGQVIINLVNNAFLHAFDGRDSGELRIRATADPVRPEVELVFSDDGVGMSEDTLAQLFHPFFSTKPGQGGTGLGMMIVGDLVRKPLGGTLTVQSTVGVGTRVALTLPLVAPQASE